MHLERTSVAENVQDRQSLQGKKNMGQVHVRTQLFHLNLLVLDD